MLRAPSGLVAASQPFLKVTAHPLTGWTAGVSDGHVAESAIV